MKQTIVYLVQFIGPNQPGDFRWHHAQPGSSDDVYIFPDNTMHVGYAGAACIRDLDTSCGVTTILVEDGRMRPFQTVEEAVPYVEECMNRIEMWSNEPGTKIYLPVGPDGKTLGCGTFDVPLDVRKYITARIMHAIRKHSRGDVVIDTSFLKTTSGT